VPAIRVLWETAEKMWQRSFALFVAVKHCGRFIVKGNRFFYFQSNGKVKRKWPIGGRLWILFWSIWLKIKAIVCVIIVAWNSVVNRLLVTSCEILVTTAKFLVALAIRKAQFQTLEQNFETLSIFYIYLFIHVLVLFSLIYSVVLNLMWLEVNL